MYLAIQIFFAKLPHDLDAVRLRSHICEQPPRPDTLDRPAPGDLRGRASRQPAIPAARLRHSARQRSSSPSASVVVVQPSAGHWYVRTSPLSCLSPVTLSPRMA